MNHSACSMLSMQAGDSAGSKKGSSASDSSTAWQEVYRGPDLSCKVRMCRCSMCR